MKDQTETPLTERKVVRHGSMRETGTRATETSVPAAPDLAAELASLRLLIRRQDEVVERLLSERAGSESGRAKGEEDAPAAKRAKRSTRRGLLTQLAAGAAGVAAAAVYGTTKAGTANAEFNGTVQAGSFPQYGLYGWPNGVTQFPAPLTVVGGVWGQGDNGAPHPIAGAGVIGISNAAMGVLGQSSNSVGVYGHSDASTPLKAGVYGYSTNGVNPGIRGENFQFGGVGVRGEGGSTGVFGLSGSGPGVQGVSTDAPGVRGQSFLKPGVEGVSTHSLGVRGTSTNFVGIVGISSNNHGLYGSTNAGAGVYGIVAENVGANGPGLLITGSAPSQVYGGLQVFGVKNAVLKMQDGSFASVYCQESPEPWFEDFGRGQLVSGVANVPLEREFATLVAGGDYMVFTHPQGDTKGLFVSRQGPSGFEVREVQGGAGNVPFTYRIVTKRKDIEGQRFARVDTSAAEKVAGVRAMLSSMDTPGGPSPITPPSTPPVTPPTPGGTVSPSPTVTPPGAPPSAGAPSGFGVQR